MSTTRTPQRGARLVAALVVAGSVSATAPDALGSAGTPDADGLKPVITELDRTRGLVVGTSKRLVYSEANGTITQTIRSGPDEGTEVLVQVPPSYVAAAVSQTGKRTLHILTPQGDPDSGAWTLYRWKEKSGKAKAIADIAAYQVTDPDPDNVDGHEPDESNPYGVATLPDDSALVSDAAGNDLLRVYKNGDIETVARIKPRTVLVPDELEGQPDLPPPGTPMEAEGVATAVTVGSDGYYYLGELRGFPATPGTSEVWRIAPDSVGAVCDPENPDTGDCQRFADGFTSIVDLAAGPDGEIYVLEMVQQSWLQWERGLADGVGALFEVDADGSSVELLTDAVLSTPGGVDTSKNGTVYVSSPIFDTGFIGRVRD